jgi:hypothetical protein
VEYCSNKIIYLNNRFFISLIIILSFVFCSLNYLSSKVDFDACNILRDEKLFNLGILVKDDDLSASSLDSSTSSSFVELRKWKQLTSIELEILKKQREKPTMSATSAASDGENKGENKENDKKLTQRLKDFKKWEYAHLSVREFFKQVYLDTYLFSDTSCDEETPTLGKDKAPLSKQKLKLVSKIAVEQRTIHEKFKKRMETEGKDFRQGMLDEIKLLKK